MPESHANFVLARRAGVDQAPVTAALAARDILVRATLRATGSPASRITVGTDEEINALLTAPRTILPPLC